MIHTASIICGQLVLVCLCAVSGQTVRAWEDDTFPYTATVQGEDAIIRSGPGTMHYGTDRLKPGSEVQVYRHDPGGWMAIRPPAGSFSLIQADEVRLLDNGMAQVIHPEAVAWVGTKLNPVEKPLWQIRLRKGETLRVLGTVDREKFELDDHEPDWIQVAPPAGEFRWIASQHIRRTAADRETGDPPVDEMRIDGSVNADSAPPASGQRPFESWDTPRENSSDDWSLEIESEEKNPPDKNLAAPASQPDGLSGWKPARQTIANFVENRSQFVAESTLQSDPAGHWTGSVTREPPSGSDSNVRSDIFDAQDTSSPAGTAPGLLSPGLQSPTFASGAMGTPALAGQSLEMLEMKLTEEMLKPPGQWELMSLAAQVEQLRQSSTSASDTATANRLLDKIRKCREIKAGYRATGRPADLETRIPGASGSPGSVLAGAGGQVGQNGGQNGLLHHYDAYGYLAEMVQNGGLAPNTFVLKDEQGRITHHVQAPPGLNLRRYLNQRVGVIGNRGFHQRYNMEHVTAERVIAIDTLRR